MRSLFFLTAMMVLGWSSPAAAGQTGGASMSILNHADLGSLELRLDAPGPVTIDQFRKSLGPGSLSFRAYGRHFELQLADNGALRAYPQNIAVPDGTPGQRPYRLLKGKLAGQPDTWVRITLAGDRLRGVIWDGRELYGIGPTGELRDVLINQPRDDSTHVIYRLADTYLEPGVLACGVGGPTVSAGSAADAYGELIGELRQDAEVALLTATRELDLSAVADLDFVQDFGSNSEAALMSRFNIVDGIFSEQVGVRIRVTEMVLEQQGDGTFSSDDPSTLLEQLADLRVATPALRDTGLSHLYTGRSLDGDVIGIAYLDSLCEARFGTGLSQSGATETRDALIAAHEIGHNFGAVHDGEPPCENAGGIFLMSPNLNGSDRFSQCSLDTILPVAAAAGCVTSVNDVDVSLSVSPESTERLQTRNVGLTFRATNSGLGNAEDVLVDIAVPNAFSIVGTDPSSGSCVPAAGGASCNIGTLTPGSTGSVTVTLGSGQIGIFNVGGTVGAAGDATPGDNNASTVVTIRPAVELSVRFAGGPVSLETSGSATRTVTIANNEVGPASDVELIVSAPAGLDVASATPDRGTCNITARQATCIVPSLPAADDYSIAVTTTGRQAGAYTVDARVSASESDLDGTNDAASLSYTVAQAANSGGGGGGGAVGVELMLLVLLPLARRQRRRRHAIA